VAQNGTKKGRKGVEVALIAALAAGGSVPAAAAHAGCSLRTAYRRLEDPAFRQAVEAARADLVQQTVGRLSALGVLAAEGLQDLLKSPLPGVKLGAVRTALEHLFRGAMHDNLQRLVAEMQNELERLRHHHERQPSTNGKAPAGHRPGAGPAAG
jgi:hypothetical protein